MQLPEPPYYAQLKKEIFKKIKTNLILDEIDKELSEIILNVEEKSYQKLVKQLAYDFLVEKRRAYKNDDLIKDKAECKNPANFPDENSPFDITRHIDCLTAWTEEWEDIECGEIKFKYLKNLDADIMILGKDSTGKSTHEKYIRELGEYNADEVRRYVNKETQTNPFSCSSKKDILNEFRLGFSPKGVRTMTNLRKFSYQYLEEKICKAEKNEGEIIPKKNKNIFLTNSFVFLSAGEISPSFVPDELFKKSVEEFIIPLLNIIKPKAVIQCGTEAIFFSRNSIHDLIENNKELKELNPKYEDNLKKHKSCFSSLGELLKTTHKCMFDNKPKNFLYHINWNSNATTHFFPVNHPSHPLYYYKTEQERDGHYVWKYITRYIDQT
jgi:hypothetical protein